MEVGAIILLGLVGTVVLTTSYALWMMINLGILSKGSEGVEQMSDQSSSIAPVGLHGSTRKSDSIRWCSITGSRA